MVKTSIIITAFSGSRVPILYRKNPRFTLGDTPRIVKENPESVQGNSHQPRNEGYKKSLREDKESLIVILGGSLVREGKNVWRTTTFEDTGPQSLGDRLRVLAGASLYHKNKTKGASSVVLVSGGRGTLTNVRGAPTVARVIKKELIVLGVPKIHILTEEDSRNTFQQLRELQTLAEKTSYRAIHVITNEYHIPRVKAMIECVPALGPLLRLCKEGRLLAVSAEKEVSAYDTLWRATIAVAYQTSAMRTRIDSERRGVKQLRAGTYTF